MKLHLHGGQTKMLSPVSIRSKDRPRLITWSFQKLLIPKSRRLSLDKAKWSLSEHEPLSINNRSNWGCWFGNEKVPGRAWGPLGYGRTLKPRGTCFGLLLACSLVCFILIWGILRLNYCIKFLLCWCHENNCVSIKNPTKILCTYINSMFQWSNQLTFTFSF